eukprot:TRINITY_DN41285_c0_g1_i1.p1 TRINITY_DN41285_c0_g1~~TRINITY_DN41285_c0_g1_i1.p1  ORF type:complete len:156 (-),score=35.17 TRINITY_DN41285_c0_g1_i1:290-757(-)
MGPPNMMPPPGYPGAPPSGQHSAFGGSMRGSAFPANSAVEMSQATIVPDDHESPTRKSKKSKAERSDSQSHERRSKSRDKKDKRRESMIRGDDSAADFSETTTGAFNNTNALDNFDGTKREKKEKKKDKADKSEKKTKKEKSKSKKDRRELDDEN